MSNDRANQAEVPSVVARRYPKACSLLGESQLFVKRLFVPEEPLLHHDAILPPSNGCHLEAKGVVGGRHVAIGCRHWFGEGTFHNASSRGPVAGGNLDWVFGNAGIGQALAALPDGRRILVDTGESPRRPGCKKEFCGAWNDRVVAGLTEDLQGDPIDMVWITHQHSDHRGGLPTFPAATVIEHYVDNGTREDKAGAKNARKAAVDRGASLHEVSPTQLELPIANTEEVQIEAAVPAERPATVGQAKGFVLLALTCSDRRLRIQYAVDPGFVAGLYAVVQARLTHSGKVLLMLRELFTT